MIRRRSSVVGRRWSVIGGRCSVVGLLTLVACGRDGSSQINLVVPPEAGVTCANGPANGVAATLFVSGNIQPCTLTVTNGVASGDCAEIPTGIERFLVLRYAVPTGSGTIPLRYALTRADLTPDNLAKTVGSLTITFADDGVTGMYVDTDADIAQLANLLYGAETMLSGAICYARSIIAADGGVTDVVTDCRASVAIPRVLDLDGDSCTNLRELCDGTPIEVDSGTTCVN